MLVLDTGALVYWTLDPERLSPAAAEAIATADTVMASSISIWEIGQKVKRGELSLPLRLTDYVEKLNSVAGLALVAVDEKCWLRSLVLDWDHTDIADRTIVATAMVYSCELVSSDPEIRAFYSKAIW